VNAYVGLERRRWLERIEQGNDNLRAALAWAQEVGAAGVLIRLVASLGWFWELEGRRVEARGWVEITLAARVRVLHMAGLIARGCIRVSALYLLKKLGKLPKSESRLAPMQIGAKTSEV
jgi:hypothetical protein